jgi:hypothetical protein
MDSIWKPGFQWKPELSGKKIAEHFAINHRE